MMESEFANSKNPWEEIDLDTYEKHMRLDTVRQLQAMNAIMKQQFEAYPVQTAMVLGVAGGNGLEHIRAKNTRPFTELTLTRITCAPFPITLTI